MGRDRSRRLGYEHILISSSDTADGVRTPDSVMMPEIRSGGYFEEELVTDKMQDRDVRGLP
jgi:hypothetical protein